MRYTLALLAAAIAVEASPFPQAVTAAISPSAPAPSGCMPTYMGTFGIAVMNLTSSASKAAGVTTLPDGQPGASTKASIQPVTTISDGQPQATTKASIQPITTISDGQPQAPTKVSVAPVSQISDGQIQATTKPMMMTMSPINQISDGQIQNQKSTVKPVSTISDGQPQAPKTTMSAQPVSTISDGQPQAPKSTAMPVSTISDGQPQAPKPTVTPVGTISDGQPQASKSAVPSPSGMMSNGTTMGGGIQYVACKSSDTLQVTLANGILKDNLGRTGYIASNYQFQFDGPPQAGALYTAGFSACGNGSLALGGSAVFYQCLSGNFYNLYDRKWAAQCSPINIQIVQLQNC